MSVLRCFGKPIMTPEHLAFLRSCVVKRCNFEPLWTLSICDLLRFLSARITKRFILGSCTSSIRISCFLLLMLLMFKAYMLTISPLLSLRFCFLFARIFLIFAVFPLFGLCGL
jgi:hypothetical protein